MLSIPIVTQFDKTGITKALSGLSKLENNAEKASRTFKKLGKAAAVGFAAVGAAAATAAYAAFDFVKAAIDDDKAAKLLANSLKNTTKATDKQIKATEDFILKTSLATGVTDDELRPAFEKIARSTRNLGKAQKLLGTAQNIAAATGKPLAATSKAVAQAYAGQFGALKKLSPEVAQLIKDGASADEVFAQLDKTFAGAAETAANSTAGKFQRFQVAVGELKEGIGSLLLPAMSQLAGFLTNTVIPAFENFQKAVEKDGFAKVLGDYIKRGFDWLISTGVPLAIKKTKEFANAVVEYMAPRWAPLAKKLGNLLVQYGNWLTGTFYPYLTKEIPKAMKAFGDWFDRNSEVIVQGTIKVLAALGIWIATSGAPAIAKLAAAIFLALFKLDKQITKAIIGQLIAGLGEIKDAAASKFAELGQALGKALANGVISGVNKAIDAMNHLIEKVIGLAGALGPVGYVAAKALGSNAKIPHIPALAQGGIVSSPTLALIGESGPEAVVPLNRMGAMGGDINITIQTGVGDPVAIGREVNRVLSAYSRRVGTAA